MVLRFGKGSRAPVRHNQKINSTSNAKKKKNKEAVFALKVKKATNKIYHMRENPHYNISTTASPRSGKKWANLALQATFFRQFTTGDFGNWSLDVQSGAPQEGRFFTPKRISSGQLYSEGARGTPSEGDQEAHGTNLFQSFPATCRCLTRFSPV